MASRKYLIVEKREEVARVTINDPERRNRLAREVIEEMISVYDELRLDKKIVVVIMTGAGDVAFSAGLGGQWLLQRYEDVIEAQPKAARQTLSEMIYTYPKVTMAAVNGYCLGGALGVLAAHDLAIASEERARFGLPEVMRGFPPMVVMPVLVRSIPTKWSFDMLLSGDNMDARTAQKAGLITRIVPHAQLQEAAFQWAKEIARWDPLTLEYCKQLTHSVMEEPVFSKAMEIDRLIHDEHARVNPRAMQGMRNFLGKTGVKANQMMKWV